MGILTQGKYDAAPTAETINHKYIPILVDSIGRVVTANTPSTPTVAYHEATSGDAVHSTVQLIAAPSSGSLYITDFEITNDSTAAITVKFMEDTAGGATQKGGTKYIPASSGIVSNLKTPIKCTAAKNFGFTNTGQSNYSITLHYYTLA